MTLSERIRIIRETYNLTQSDVAEKFGISPSGYGQIERQANKSSFETLQKVAAAIGVSVLFLIDINSSKFMEQN